MKKKKLAAILVIPALAATVCFSASNAGAGERDCASIGDKCSDDSVYAGRSADQSSRIFVTPKDAPRPLAWYGARPTLGTITGIESKTNGQSNTIALQNFSRTGVPHPAAAYCANLKAHGRQDWYLPSKEELSSLYLRRALIGSFDSHARYWSSTEYSNLFAWSQTFGTGFQSGDVKSSPLNVRCMRKEFSGPEI
jgi:hypothetical protein